MDKIMSRVIAGLIFLSGIVMYAGQQAFGWFSFPTAGDRQVWLFVVFTLISAGFVGISVKQIPLTWFKHWAVSMLVIYGVFTALQVVGLNLDAARGTDVYGGRAAYMLDAAASTVTTWQGIGNIVLSCVPIALVLIMTIMMIAGDGPDEYGTVLMEMAFVLILVIGVPWLFNLTLGINIFQPF